MRWTPCRFSPPGVVCNAEGGFAVFLLSSGAARPKGCFTAYDIRRIAELSRRTTGRPGDISPDTAHAIGGTYDTLSSPQDPFILSGDYGRMGLEYGAYGQHCRTRRGCRTVYKILPKFRMEDTCMLQHKGLLKCIQRRCLRYELVAKGYSQCDSAEPI